MSILTFNEAIKRFNQEAKVCEENTDNYTRNEMNILAAISAKEAADYRQLARWLTELRDRQWVSVNERLPEFIDSNFSEDVLIHLKNGEQYVAIFIGEDTENRLEAYWATNDMHRHFECDEVTHWQPRPKSPEI